MAAGYLVVLTPQFANDDRWKSYRGADRLPPHIISDGMVDGRILALSSLRDDQTGLIPTLVSAEQGRDLLGDIGPRCEIIFVATDDTAPPASLAFVNLGYDLSALSGPCWSPVKARVRRPLYARVPFNEWLLFPDRRAADLFASIYTGSEQNDDELSLVSIWAAALPATA